MNDSVLGLLGLARKAGKLETGDEPVSLAAREHRARLLVVASDASDGTRRKAEGLATKNCPVLPVPYTKERLGAAVGRANCALAAVTDSGFAATLAKGLVKADPECAPQAAELERRAQKKLRRRRKKE